MIVISTLVSFKIIKWLKKQKYYTQNRDINVEYIINKEKAKYFYRIGIGKWNTLIKKLILIRGTITNRMEKSIFFII